MFALVRYSSAPVDPARSESARAHSASGLLDKINPFAPGRFLAVFTKRAQLSMLAGIWDVVESLHGRLRERERRDQGQAFVVHCGVRPQDRGGGLPGGLEGGRRAAGGGFA